MEVPHKSGYASCKFLAVGCPSVQQRTLGKMLMRMRMGRRRGGSRRRGPAVMGRGWFTGEEEDVEKDFDG
eukprot:1149853-Pelagomonas_calceolata.AAC.4